jgi:hypothetical protein
VLRIVVEFATDEAAPKKRREREAPPRDSVPFRQHVFGRAKSKPTAAA